MSTTGKVLLASILLMLVGATLIDRSIYFTGTTALFIGAFGLLAAPFVADVMEDDK